MMFEPLFERTVLFLQLLNGLGVFDGGVDFQPVPDDAGICHQAFPILFGVGRYLVDIKLVVCLSEGIFFLQDGLPAKPGLVYFHQEPAEQFMIVMNRESVVLIVVPLVQLLSISWWHIFDGLAV